MPLCQVASRTKLAKVAAPALGRGGAASCCWVPRPSSYGEAFEPEVQRSWTGISEYLYALSPRHPAAILCNIAQRPRVHSGLPALLASSDRGSFRVTSTARL